MAAENKPNNGNKDKKRKRYLSHSKSVKKGSYPLHPGVQGFFITCDGGRERQASQEAINVLDTFYEQLVDDEDSGVNPAAMPNKPLNKKIKFSDSDSDSSSDDEESGQPKEEDAHNENQTNEDGEKQHLEKTVEQEEDANRQNQTDEAEESSAKKQRLETDLPKCENVVNDEPKNKSIDKLIDDELRELKDRSKRRFVGLDSGCNGVVFVQMLKRNGDPGPAEIVKHMMTSAAATRKHMSRFILRVLPVELTCYASEEEISKAIKPLIDQYFPAEAQTPLKFAVLYDARANTGIDRMAIIKAVAKSVPEPHKVDLNNPDKSIIVQIAKTVCSIGVVEKYKELSKYNLRQLTSPKA
ncbi:hypothetical protein AQUCO_00900329v1 [Aquilegia coerulea]|uniref:THUMP domain-containing protein n=1 Tax=Aquilegia coerulea TaxID=218851 RepID=A0A2G5ED82_AQUCA|nr:hypothetical protein AQUCO_00900329v1 [Aquilegia coerulea]